MLHVVGMCDDTQLGSATFLKKSHLRAQGEKRSSEEGVDKVCVTVLLRTYPNFLWGSEWQ